MTTIILGNCFQVLQTLSATTELSKGSIIFFYNNSLRVDNLPFSAKVPFRRYYLPLYLTINFSCLSFTEGMTTSLSPTVSFGVGLYIIIRKIIFRSHYLHYIQQFVLGVIIKHYIF
jgi:hypothetical protein